MAEVNQTKKPKDNKPVFITVIIILLLAVIGMVIWQMSTRSTLNGLIQEKELQRAELKRELDSLITEHQQVKTAYGELADSLTVKDSIINANAEEIKKLLNTQYEYYKVKKKLANLQVISQGYVRQVDSLYRVNEVLQKENVEMKENISTLKKEVETISKDREVLSQKVEIASFLKAYNAKAVGLRIKSGSSKEVETDKVSRLDAIKVCFTVAQNELAIAGGKIVYVRIARPDKEILTISKMEEYTFEFEGKSIQYSIKESFQYENVAVELCLYWKKIYSEQQLPAGLYYVDIFCEGVTIGQTTFTLR